MIDAIYKKAIEHKWEIGFIENSINQVLAGDNLKIKWVKNPIRDRWFADPFILDVTPSIIVLLVEEFSYELKKGRIAKLIIDRKSMEILQFKIILELTTHLSFPAIIRDKGDVYIYPENHQSGCLKMYKYDVNSEQCREVKVLCKEPLTDAVRTELFGRPLIFSTKYPHQNGSSLDVYEEKNGSFQRFKEITFNENIARMAGDFFKVDGNIYRPAQECNVFYGHGVSIQKVSKDFEFTEVRRLLSPHPNLKLGIHTLNYYKGNIVIDVKGFRHHWIGSTLFNLRHSLY